MFRAYGGQSSKKEKVYFDREVINGLGKVIEWLKKQESHEDIDKFVVNKEELLKDAENLVANHKNDPQNKVNYSNTIIYRDRVLPRPRGAASNK